jgi:hypothetical protein
MKLIKLPVLSCKFSSTEGVRESSYRSSRDYTLRGAVSTIHGTATDDEEQLIEAEETHGEGAYDASKTLCVGLARMGQPTQKMVAGTLEELATVDMGEPLHSMII